MDRPLQLDYVHVGNLNRGCRNAYGVCWGLIATRCSNVYEVGAYEAYDKTRIAYASQLKLGVVVQVYLRKRSCCFR